MKRKGIIALLLLVISLVTGCAKNDTPPKSSQAEPSQTTSGVYHKISAEEAYHMMKDTGKYILLDVRTKDEYDQSHIDGAVLIPDNEIAAKAGEQLPDRSAVILVYCRSGRRSAGAAQQLIDMGYTNVYDFGGIIDWPYDLAGGGAKEK